MATGSFKLPNTATSTPTDPYAWVRPSDWLAMPTIGTQEFIGLLAITDDESNHIALLCAGAYTVDWGDGVTENVATGVKAQHTYTYSAISNSTISTRGYKQVLVRVTPQAGQNLTTVNLQQQNSIIAKKHTVGWLDIAVKGSNITTLTLGGTLTLYMGMCENVDIYSFGAISNLSILFYNFLSLQKFTLPSTASVTNFSNMFTFCTSLKTIPTINTQAATNVTGMFQNCYSLREIPLLNFSNVNNFDQCFSFCNNMQNYPLLDTSKGTNFNNMFDANYTLQKLPNLSTILGTTFANMLRDCNSISKAAFQGTRYSISYATMCLSQSEIVNIFNGLGTAVGTPTITVSSNPGYAALTAAEKLIATGKGFTIA